MTVPYQFAARTGSIELSELDADFTYIEGQVTSSTSNIAANTAAIAVNTADIATNTADIAINTADIAKPVSSYTYYVATTGSNGNPGTVGSPFLTLAYAFSVLEGLSAYFSGSITINIAAGSYDGAAFPDGVTSKNRITIAGVNNGEGVRPTTIISGSVGSSTYGLFFQRFNNVFVRDIEITGFSGNAESGIAGADWCDVYTKNVWLINNFYNLNFRGWARLRFQGGCIKTDGYAGVLCFDFAFVTIGYMPSGVTPTVPTVDPTISGTSDGTGTYINATVRGALWSENTQGHMDYCLIQGAGPGGIGFEGQYASRPNFGNVSCATTAASGTGATATVTFSGGYTLNVGSWVTITGMTPTGYNGTYQVTASSAGSVSFANATTGAQSVAGTLVWGTTIKGCATGVKGRSGMAFIGPPVMVTNTTDFDLSASFNADRNLYEQRNLGAVVSLGVNTTGGSLSANDAYTKIVDTYGVLPAMSLRAGCRLTTIIRGKCQKVTGANLMFLRLYFDNSFAAAAAFPTTAAFTGSSVRYVCTMDVLGITDATQEIAWTVELSNDTGSVFYRSQGVGSGSIDVSADDKNLSIYGWKTSGDSLDVENVYSTLFSTFG